MGSMALADVGTFDVASALETGTKLINWVFTSISSNAILTAVFVVATLVPAGIGIFRHLKNAV